MDEPKVERRDFKNKAQFVISQNNQILYVISSRKMAVSLCDQIKEGGSTNHGKEPPSTAGSTTKPPA
jgi:hypothetical protein